MKRLNNEEGIALLMTLVLSAVVLAMMSGLIYMVTVGTQVSGVEKRYNTALEAGHGGTDVTIELLNAGEDPGIFTDGDGFEFNIPALNVGGTDCLDEKLYTHTYDASGVRLWPAECDSDVAINPGDVTTYDVVFSLGTEPLKFNVYAKIVDTFQGNTVRGSSGWKRTGVVVSETGQIKVQPIPYLYTVEAHAENSLNPAERAKLSIMYQY
jgi:hypothetical protein